LYSDNKFGKEERKRKSKGMSPIKKIAAELPDEYAYKSPTVRVTLGAKKGKNKKKSRNEPFDQINNENKR